MMQFFSPSGQTHHSTACGAVRTQRLCCWDQVQVQGLDGDEVESGIDNLRPKVFLNEQLRSWVVIEGFLRCLSVVIIETRIQGLSTKHSLEAAVISAATLTAAALHDPPAQWVWR